MTRKDLEKYLCDYLYYDDRINTDGVDVEDLIADSLYAFESTTETEIIVIQER